MTVRRVSAILIMGLLTGPLQAQDPGSVEHPACYHEEFQALDFLSGSWSVSGSVRRPDGEWEDVDGTSEIVRDLGGCILSERYEDDRSEGRFFAVATYSYDPIDRRHQKTWIDSAHGLATHYRGGEVSGKIVFSSSKEIRGTVHHFVEEYTVESASTFVLERRRATGNRQSWRATSRITYERR